MNLTQIFCDADDFCQKFIPEWKKTRLEGEEKITRARARSICESEIITLVVRYHISGYRTFKWFYQRHVQKYYLADFPGLPSYNRFIQMIADVLVLPCFAVSDAYPELRLHSQLTTFNF